MNDTIIPNDNTNANRNFSTVQCDIFVNIWNQLYTQGFQEISSVFPGYVLDWKYGSRSRWVVTSQCGSLPSGLPYFQFQNFDILQISSGFFGLFLDIGYEEDIPKSCLHQRWVHLFQALELWDLIGLIRFFGLISGFRYEKDTPRSVLHRRWVYHFVALEFWNFRRFHQVFGNFCGTMVSSEF